MKVLVGVVELVGVRGIDAGRMLDEGQRQAVKELRRAQPDVLVAAVLDCRLEQCLVRAAHEAVGAVRADEEIVRRQRRADP